MIDRIVNLLNHESSSITLAALLLAAASFAADILGLLRDRILATSFGAGELLDIYYLGFRIPDLLLNLFVLGAMSSALLPVFAERYARDREDAWKLAQNLFTLVALLLTGLAVVLFFILPWLMPLIAPGFAAPALERADVVTRILLLSPILFGLSSLASAILHYFQRFLLYSLAPILYNIGIIAGALLFAPRFGEAGLALGVVLGAAMHFAIQVPGLRAAGFRFRFSLTPVHDAVREVGKLALPRTLNLVANQLQLTVLTAIASAFAAGSIAVFNFATNLAFVPVGVIGISFATAAFPALSRAAAAGDRRRFGATLLRTIQQVLFFALPASALFLVLRAHIVRVVLGAGAFTWEDTRLTAALLAASAVGVAAYSLLPLLVRAFFGTKDTLTPFVIAVASALLTIGLTLGLRWGLDASSDFRGLLGGVFRVADLPDIRILALPIAMTVAVTFQVSVLLFKLRRDFSGEELRHLASGAFRLAISSVAAGGTAWGTLQVVAGGVAQETFVGILLQGFAAGIAGAAVFFFFAFTFAFPEAQRLMAAMRRSLPPLSAVLPRSGSNTDEEGRRGMEQ